MNVFRLFSLHGCGLFELRRHSGEGQSRMGNFLGGDQFRQQFKILLESQIVVVKPALRICRNDFLPEPPTQRLYVFTPKTQLIFLSGYC